MKILQNGATVKAFEPVVDDDDETGRTPKSEKTEESNMKDVLKGTPAAAPAHSAGCCSTFCHFIKVQWRFISSTISKIVFGQVILVVIWNAGVVVLFHQLEKGEKMPIEWEHLTVAANTVLKAGIGFLSFLIVFEKQGSYARWWEARCLWGGIIAYAVQLAQLATVHIEDEKLAERIVRHTITYCFMSKQLLREEPLAWEELQGLISEEEFTRIQEIGGWNVLYSLDVVRACVEKAYEKQPLGSSSLTLTQAFENCVSGLWFGCGGCLRIRYTPIPASHEGFMVTMTWLYLILLPFAMVADMGWWVMLVSIIMSWLMVGMQNQAWELLEPFGDHADDLPLDKYCEAIRVQCCSVFLRCRGQKENLIAAPAKGEHFASMDDIEYDLSKINSKAVNMHNPKEEDMMLFLHPRSISRTRSRPPIQRSISGKSIGSRVSD